MGLPVSNNDSDILLLFCFGSCRIAFSQRTGNADHFAAFLAWPRVIESRTSREFGNDGVQITADGSISPPGT
jgi:hypothetical protein